jgi:hypothetical protein
MVAVLSRLSSEHGHTEGYWFVECAFGPAANACDEEFPDMDGALEALKLRVGG